MTLLTGSPVLIIKKLFSRQTNISSDNIYVDIYSGSTKVNVIITFVRYFISTLYTNNANIC